MRLRSSFAVISLLFLASVGLQANVAESSDDPTSTGGIIINRYLLATQASPFKTDSVEVNIDATVPRLNEHATMRVLRKISIMGKITYRVLGFQGDSSVKSQVIARYLQAEQQGQDDNSIKLTPANYKFRFKGARSLMGHDAYVFQVSPRAKRVGLFKGELWLDAKAYLPVLEKGRLVKNPSIFFRKVDFERDFSILNGLAIPAHMSSTIDTRLVGKVNLSVAYSDPSPETQGSTDEASAAIPSSF